MSEHTFVFDGTTRLCAKRVGLVVAAHHAPTTTLICQRKGYVASKKGYTSRYGSSGTS